jgi:glycosyltransferase involved in cell wall biosynthesis
MRITKYRSDFPLLIAQVHYAHDETAGDFYYRAFAPGAGMAHYDGVYVVNLVSLHRLRHEVMLDADVLVLNNICDADLLPVIRDRKDRGKLTIFEVADDVEVIPPASPAWHFYQQSNNLLLIKRLAHYCDALQFCTPELERKYGYLNPKCCVFPNQILVAPPERTQKTEGTVIVGWGGSISHLQDMAKISDCLVHWIMSRDDVHLYLMCADEIWELFEALPSDRKRRFAVGSIDDYYRFVSHLDIGIGPLEDTPFNRSKSDVKALEYAAHGVVPVVQATGPYLPTIKEGMTGFFFNTPDELISTLDHLVSNASARTRVSAFAREYVLRERNCIEHAKDRIEFYRSLIAKADGGCKLSSSGTANTFTRLRDYAGARKTGRHLLLSRTRFELLLQAGQLASHLSIQSKAWNRFAEAIEMEPSQYMPYLLGAFVSQDPIRMLRNALERNPSSIVSWIQLGRAYSSKGMAAEAIESFKAAAGIFPEYELPTIEWANCLHKMGRERDATALLKKAIDLIPKGIREPQTCSRTQ